MRVSVRVDLGGRRIFKKQHYINIERMACIFFFKQKTAYDMRISDWSSDVCSSDLERPTCIVLTGQSGMGKTSILREAQRRLAEAFPEPADWGEARYQPVLRTVIPSSPTSLKINLALLWKQGWPIRTNTHKTADLKVVDLLAEQGTRLVAIDNVHVILTASGVARR